MTSFPFFIDLHCHPNYKPFSRAHQAGSQVPEVQPARPSQPQSLWFYDQPSASDKLLNYSLGITKFRQASLTAGHYGNLRVMVVGLGSVEKFFFKNKLGDDFISDIASDFVAGFRKPRIDVIQNMSDYWKDLMHEMRFMADAEGHVIRMDGQYHTYKIARNFAELIVQQQQNEHPSVGISRDIPWVISLIFSCEGLHVLNCGLEQPCDPAVVKANTLALKNHPQAPWFVTFSHHFYNELCGHARSLRKQVGSITNQEEGLGKGFTGLGLEVLEMLLDDNLGKRILIDVKHMSATGRNEFYKIRREKYADKVPVIISHGVANGLPEFGSREPENFALGRTFVNPIEYSSDANGNVLEKDHNEINFYDIELIEMVKSGGIIGLQLDERRIANDITLNGVKKSPRRHKIMHYRSDLVWKQIQYIAELLDRNGLYAWGNMAIGSDYDGMVDPLNSFWTVEEYDDLMQYLERHAWEYLKQTPHPMQLAMNQVRADKIVENIFSNNAWAFFSRWF